MKTLKNTTRAGFGKSLHNHIVYIDDEGKRGFVSENAGHSHEIEFIEGSPPVMGDNGEVIEPAKPARWFIYPANDGHTHDIIDYEPEFKFKKEKDDEIIEDIKELFKSAREIEYDSLRKAEEAEKFYYGEQWDEQEERYLESLNRAALTINLIEKNIDQLSGYHREQRADIHILPTKGMNQVSADIFNKVIKYILDNSKYHREESKVFEDAIITGRGIFNIYVSHRKNIEGDIIIEKYPYSDVVFGDHEKEDLSDCEFIIKHKMFSKAKIEQMYPDKAKKINKDFKAYDIIRDDAISKTTKTLDDQYVFSDNKTMPLVIGSDKMVDIAKKEYRVIECWRKVYMPAYVIFNPDEDFYFKAVGWKEKDVRQIKTMPGFYFVKRFETKMRVTRVAGNVVLSDEYPADLPIDDFFIVPLYAKKRGNRFWGKVEPVKDAQREINKRRSQAIDIGNKMTAYGWFFDATTFPQTEKEKFKRSATSPGFMVEVQDINRPPVKIEGVNFPVEIVNLMQLSEATLQELMNITIEPGGANESAAHLLHRQKMKMAGNEYLFDNLSFVKQKIGYILLKLIKTYFSPERILSIVGEEEYSLEDIEDALDMLDESKVELTVTETSKAPTTRIATYMLLSDLARSGIQVPPEVLIDLADIPQNKKDEILQMIEQQSQAMAEAEKAKAEAEIDKTLIAQGLMPPKIQKKLQDEQQEVQQTSQEPNVNFIESEQQGVSPLSQ